MGYRLTRITTRTGDDGSTGLGDGSRTSKSAPRIAALGDIDELNSAVGLLLTEPLAPIIASRLFVIQNTLFDVGGELCIPRHRLVEEAQVLDLDEWLGELNSSLQPLREFILPGGCKAAALCHVARTVCRRAERSVVGLAAMEDVSTLSLQYLNRLSDLLFVLARHLNDQADVPDTLWKRAT